LRWKEVVTALETSLNLPPTASGEWALAQSAAAWRALSTCWDSDVYISELANRFWRLSLQICSRYGSWLQSQLKEGEDPSTEEHSLKTSAAAVSDLELFKRKLGEIAPLQHNGLIRELAASHDVWEKELIRKRN
jgi:hypothetical protein